MRYKVTNKKGYKLAYFKSVLKYSLIIIVTVIIFIGSMILFRYEKYIISILLYIIAMSLGSLYWHLLRIDMVKKGYLVEVSK